MSSHIVPSTDSARDPPPKRRSTLLTVCPFILGNELCERLAYNGLATNLVIYLTQVMGQDNGFAAVQVNLFEGTCYLTPLLGAWLADAYWGRYKTIVVFSFIYLVGMVLLALSATVPALVPDPDAYPTALQNAALYAALYTVALGTGGIKPNVSAFGADQFDMSNSQDRKEKTSFFNWFYFFVNIGSLLAVTAIVWVQENISWGVGFAVPAACMGLAILVFTAGSARYTRVEPTESPLARVYHVIAAAWKERRRAAGGAQAQAYLRAEASDPDLVASLLPPSSGAGADAADGPRAGTLPPPPRRGLPRTASLAWLDAAGQARVTPGGARRFSTSQVDEVKMVLRLFPIFATTILYWTIYMQMGSFFVEQGALLNRNVSIPRLDLQFTIPAASLTLVNTLAIVVLIPLYDALLLPFLRLIKIRMTLLRRIGAGLAVCAAAMVWSAALERRRLAMFEAGEVLPGPHSATGAVVNLSVWHQTPQYLLIGLSEVFTSVGQLEFFYDQAPDVMRSCSMALQLLSVAVGSYLSGALVWLTTAYTRDRDPAGQGWLPKDLNRGRLDLFLLLLAALMVLNTAVYLWVARRFEYKAVVHQARIAAPRKPPRPAPPAPRPRSALVPTTGASLAHAADREGPGGVPESPMASMYGRSVTFLPPSPVMPAPRR